MNVTLPSTAIIRHGERCLTSLRQLFALLLVLVSATAALAQPTVLGTTVADGSTYITYDLPLKGAFRQSPNILATSSGSANGREWQFASGTAASVNYSFKWMPYASGGTRYQIAGYNQSIAPNTVFPPTTGTATYVGNAGVPGGLPAVVAGRYYTFNVTNNAPNADNTMSVLETTYSPVAISTVTQMPAAASVGKFSYVTVTASLAAAPNGSEYFYLRYSNDGGATYPNTVAMTVSGMSATGVIPGQAASASVKYYVFSSPISTVAGLGSNYDMLTLNLNNNSGSNYSYTVGTSVCGTYGIDNSMGTATGSAGVFNNFTNAFAFLNGLTATCATTIYVTAGQTFSEASLSLQKGGSVSNVMTFVKSGAGANPKILTTATGASTVALDIYGINYVTFDGIDIGLDAANTVGPIYGYRIRNKTATQGASNNTIQNATISLNRATVGSIGATISTNGSYNGAVPTNATGTNNANLLKNLTITNCQTGVVLASGNVSTTLNLSDYGNEVAGCTIGAAATADDLGGALNTAVNYGIYDLNEYHALIHDNTVQNVTGISNSGIAVVGAYGAGTDATNVYNNRINAIHGTGSTTNTKFSRGLTLGTEAASATLAATLNCYNNIVTGVVYAATSATTSRQLIGIYVAGTGTTPGTVQVVNVYYNTVVIDPSGLTGGTLTNNACLEIGAVAQLTNVENNIFVNTTNYTGTSTNNKHYVIYTAATSGPIGGPGSVSDYNDLYFTVLVNGSPAADGYTGSYNGTNYVTLASATPNWQSITGGDAHSLAVDPTFDSNYKPTNTAALDNKGTSISGFTTDISGATRSATTPDVGAYEFAPIATDIKPTALAAPATGGGCYGASQAVSVTVQNSGANSLNFATNALTVTVNVTGAATQTFTTTVNTGTLAVGGTQTVALPGTLNMSAAGTYTFAITATVSGDGNTANDVLTPNPSITVTAPVVGTAAASPATLCNSGTVTLTMTGASGGTITWYFLADGYMTSIGTGTPLVLSGVSAANSYKANVVCGSTTTAFSNVVSVTVNSPSVTGTNSPATACAGGTATLTATANGGSTLYWYDTNVPAANSAAVLSTGSPFVTPAVTTSRQFYVGASVVGANQTAGRTAVPASTSTNGSLANTGLQFDAFTDFLLKTVVVYPTTASAQPTTIFLKNSSGTVIATRDLTVPAGSPTVVTPVTLTLNFAVPAGTGYQLLQTNNMVPMLIRENTNPYPLTTAGVVSITNGINPAVTTSSYYFFYNWTVAPTCNSARTAVQVNVNTTATWTGANTNWFDAANWNNGCVPNALIDAVIPNGLTTYPNLTTGAATAKSLSVGLTGTAPAAVLTISNAAVTLDLKGDLQTTNAASLVATAGTVSFTAAAAQNIGAASFFNLTVTGTAPKVLTGTATVGNVFDLSGGMLDLGANNLELTGATSTVMGAGTAHYIVAAGAGRLRLDQVGTGTGPRPSAFFPIGTSTSYNPVTLTNAGDTDDYLAGVAAGITSSPPMAMSGYVNDTWDIGEGTMGGSDVTLTLQWNAVNEQTPFDRTRVDIVHYVNNKWTPTCYTCYSPATGAAGPGPYSVTRSGYTSFSPFSVQDLSKPLPVVLTRFVATREGRDAVLDWNTASEQNSLGFEVQVSLNGQQFRKLGFVPGAGNTSVPQAYSFRDRETGKAALRYYRLRQLDQDGSESFAPVQALNFGTAAETSVLTVAPNPFGTQFVLTVTRPAAAAAHLTLTDATGRTVRQLPVQLNAGRTLVELSALDELPTGLYLLNLTSGNQVQHLKVVKP